MSTISGTIRSLNLSPKGYYESFLLDDGNDGTVQINFAHSGGDAAIELKPGQTISVNVEPLKGDRPSNHPVYRWMDQGAKSFEGVVARINYAIHGEANGAILKIGEFVHLHPHGAKTVQLVVGQTLEVEGDAVTSPAGHTVIEAHKVNGASVKHGKHKKQD